MYSTLSKNFNARFVLKTARVLLLLLAAALPGAARAQFLYTTNNNSITINQYNGTDTDVVIPDTTNGLKVTVIAPSAFFQTPNMTSLTFGANVAVIDTNAVFQCQNLLSVSMPASVTNIGQSPFCDCQKLTTLTLNPLDNFYAVSNGVLFTKSLRFIIQFPSGVGGSYTIPDAVTNVGGGFIGNTLTSIVVSNANTIYSSTNGVLFNKNKSQLMSYPGKLGGTYTVPTNVTTIVSAAFEYSPSVAGVVIGTNVTSIGQFALYDCQSLTSITVNATNAFYSATNGVLFDKNKAVLIQYPSGLAGGYIIPNTVTNLADGAFGDALGLTSVLIPNGVTNIGFETFYSCQTLSSVLIGNHVKTIAQDAFFFCPALTSIVIPASVTSLGFEAFGGCQNLASACFEGNAPTDGGSVFFFDNALSTILYVSGHTGWGTTYDGILTTPCATCGGVPPTLTITRFGTNVVLQWSDTFSSYTLEATTNLVPPATWTSVSPSPIDIGGQNTVTNSITGLRKIYRLTQ